MSAALARRSAATRVSGAGSDPPGTGRDVLADAKTERSPRSRAAMAQSRGRPDSIIYVLYYRGNQDWQTLGRTAGPPWGLLPRVFALAHLLEYTFPPFFGPDQG